MSTDVRQHGALQIFIFQKDRSPVVIGTFAGDVVAQRDMDS
jgi:hypothetical protein